MWWYRGDRTPSRPTTTRGTLMCYWSVNFRSQEVNAGRLSPFADSSTVVDEAIGVCAFRRKTERWGGCRSTSLLFPWSIGVWRMCDGMLGGDESSSAWAGTEMERKCGVRCWEDCALSVFLVSNHRLESPHQPMCRVLFITSQHSKMSSPESLFSVILCVTYAFRINNILICS